MFIVDVVVGVVGTADVALGDYQARTEPSSSPEPSDIFCKNESKGDIQTIQNRHSLSEKSGLIHGGLV